MKVVTVNSKSELYPALQKFILKHKLTFSSKEWLANYSAQSLTQCAILNKGNEIIGSFSYFQFKKSIFRFIITPPFTPHIDLFFVNPAESVVGKNSFVKEVIEVVSDYFSQLNVPYVNINLPEHIVDTQPFIWKGFLSRTRYSYLIDLKQPEEEIWNNLSSEKRKSVNKAVKDELDIQQTTNFELVYSLVIQSLERNDVARNKTIIENILFSFANADNSIGYVAYHQGKAIGASFCIIHQDKAVYLFGGFDSENKHHGAGVSCMWKSIQKAKELGLSYFDFEGSMDPKIERYFREFGGKLITYFSIQKIKPVLKIVLALKKHNPI